MLACASRGLNDDRRRIATLATRHHREDVMMIRWKPMGLAALTLLGPFAPAHAMPHGSVDAGIVKRSDAYVAAVLAGNAGAVAGFFRAEGVEMPPCVGPLEGRGAIEQYHRQMTGGPVRVTEFALDHSDCRAIGDTGYDVGTYRQTLAGMPGGPQTDTGKYVAILARVQGTWQLAYLIYNSDHPTPAPPAAAGH
jgi:uncharacterized protein (TIGR02246 family)